MSERPIADAIKEAEDKIMALNKEKHRLESIIADESAHLRGLYAIRDKQIEDEVSKRLL